MSAYNLKIIDDGEFEELICGLLNREMGVRFDRFKPGRDAGVDGRLFSNDENEIILQCKHWCRTSISQLLSSLRKNELPKVQKLNPSRYILATSIELSRSDKQKILTIFKGYIKSESDIFGHENICDLISLFPETLKSHPRLWLVNSEIIGLIQNAAILGRSAFSLNEIYEKSAMYVQTIEHKKAKEILEKYGTLLITGLPGIGKTTLANQLCLEYSVDGYEVCIINQSIEEAENIYKQETKQIFYFDDFVGSNYLKALNRHEDSTIVNFISRVSKDPLKRFILTSRSTVLNQAKQLSDRFNIANIAQNTHELKIETLSIIDKARILHRHIWFSNLSHNFLEEIFKNKRYKVIIEHKNFNPRVIQFLTDAQRFNEDSPEKFWSYIENTLNDPSAIWEHVYDNQLDDYSRLLLQIVVLNNQPISENHLRLAFESFKADPISYRYSGISDFTKQLKLVTGSVLNRNIGFGGAINFSLFNPSITDYVLERIRSDKQIIVSVFNSIDTTQSLINLNNLIKNEFIHSELAKDVIERLIKKINQSELKTEYKLKLCEIAMPFAVHNQIIKDQVYKFLNTLFLESNFDSWCILGCVLAESIKIKLISEDICIRHFANIENQEFLENPDIDSICQLYITLSQENQVALEPILKKHIVEYWQSAIQEHVEDMIDTSDFFGSQDNIWVADQIDSIIDGTLSDYPIEFSNTEISEIYESVDPQKVIDKVHRSFEREAYQGEYFGKVSISDDEIDELFKIDLPSADNN